MTTYAPTRPIMSAEELRAHHVKDEGRNYLLSCDGYDDMAINEKRGWRTLADWGKDGWNLGDWPFVVISVREVDGKFQLLSVCEGDHTYYSFDTLADREAAIDYLFLWYGAGKSWAERVGLPITWEQRDALDRGEIEVDVKWRGPYRTEG